MSAQIFLGFCFVWYNIIGDYMKLVTNFDLIDAVKNSNEQFGPYKIIRNNKKRWAKVNLPIYSIIDYSIFSFPTATLLLGLQFSLLISGELVIYSIDKVDRYKEKSDKDLIMLASALENINVVTDVDLIKRLQYDGKKYHIKVNDNKMPELIENKYVIVPTYNYNGDVKSTFLLQEHAVLSDKYVISVESPVKKLILANSYV